MPIRFRCTYCNRLLGIATRKAGTQTTCPHCAYQITVPMAQEAESRTQRVNLDDVDELLGNSATATATEAAVATPPAPPSPPPPALEPLDLPEDEVEPAAEYPAPPPRAPKPKPPAKSTGPDERPLFEGDVDEILGATPEPEADDRPKRRTVSGADAEALSLADTPRQLVLSAQTATLLMALVVVLIALAFAAGYFLAPRA